MIALDQTYAKYAEDEGVRLMLEFQAGDDAAFDRLFEMYAPAVAAVVRDLTGNDSAVLDITQDVFVRVIGARQRYVPTAKFRSWVGLITRNLVFNLMRNRRNRRTYSLAAIEAAAGEQTSSLAFEQRSVASAHDSLVHWENATTLRSAMERLVVRQRRAVQLVYFHGLSYADAASTMGTTPKAVKALLARARTQLRDDLHGSLGLDSVSNSPRQRQRDGAQECTTPAESHL